MVEFRAYARGVIGGGGSRLAKFFLKMMSTNSLQFRTPTTGKMLGKDVFAHYRSHYIPKRNDNIPMTRATLFGQ